MQPQSLSDLVRQTLGADMPPVVKATGFREYDARWWLGTAGSDKAPELNLAGAIAVGLGIGTYLHERGIRPDIVTGHDFRAYSPSMRSAVAAGLVASGCRVHDIGMGLSPTAYFAQVALDIPAVAMVTASHNEDGWTGVKMGCERPLTFGPDEMTRVKEIVLSGNFRFREGGSERQIPDFAERYIAALTERSKLACRLKVVVATGNGTAGAFAPRVLAAVGCEVVPLHTDLDHSFPHYNPNPEELEMLNDVARLVRESGADIGLAFDGDGDRCGVVDDRGRAIFADKVGLLLARDIAAKQSRARFVVDVKSTSLFATDPVLRARGATTEYWKTGHSYIKHRLNQTGAIAGFEKSGHFFFNAPIGHGYDDAIVTALAVCDMLERNPGRSLSALYDALPASWASPTMSAHCPDEEKYGVAEKVTRRIEAMAKAGEKLAGHPIAGLVTVNGVRVTTEDGSWGLVRASSNKPELVVVVESPVSDARMREMFRTIDGLLRENPEVGRYNQGPEG
jgi:phosphomannomutase/phosphoglucomutase